EQGPEVAVLGVAHGAHSEGVGHLHAVVAAGVAVAGRAEGSDNREISNLHAVVAVRAGVTGRAPYSRAQVHGCPRFNVAGYSERTARKKAAESSTDIAVPCIRLKTSL